MPRLVLAIWLPLLFTITMIILAQYCLLLIILGMFGAGDVFARGKEYYYYKSTPPNLTQIKRNKKSRCQRNVMSACSKEASRFYQTQSYRWYHLLPDNTFSLKRSPYLRVNFYRTLLGIKTT